MLHAPHEVMALMEHRDRLEQENQALRERVSALVDENYRLEYILKEYAPSWAYKPS